MELESKWARYGWLGPNFNMLRSWKQEFLGPVIEFIVSELNDISGYQRFEINDVKIDTTPYCPHLHCGYNYKFPSFRITKFLTDIERLCGDVFLDFE